jgi:hypothetical protein
LNKPLSPIRWRMERIKFSKWQEFEIIVKFMIMQRYINQISIDSCYSGRMHLVW